MQRSGGRTPGISILDSRYMLMVSFTPRPLNVPTVPRDKKFGQTPLSIWTFWRKEKSVFHTDAACNLVTILTDLTSKLK